MNDYQDEKLPPLTTVLNFRDVAGLVKDVKPGLLYRSAHIADDVPQTIPVEKILTFYVSDTSYDR
ncbi:unnamed protein product, partial [Aureobasidium vineae]